MCGKKYGGFGKCIGGKQGLCGLWVLQGGTVIYAGVDSSDVDSVVRDVDETGSPNGHLGVVDMYGVVLSFVGHFDLAVVGGIDSFVVVDFGVVEKVGLEISVVVVGESSVCIVVVCMSSVIGESVGVVVIVYVLLVHVVVGRLTVDVTVRLSHGLVVLQKLVLFRLFNKKLHSQ